MEEPDVCSCGVLKVQGVTKGELDIGSILRGTVISNEKFVKYRKSMWWVIE